MGSDTPPEELFKAVLEAEKKLCPPFSLTVLASAEILNSLASKDLSASISFSLAKDVISMGDDPLPSVRLKKQASLTLGLSMLASKTLDAFVTAGNTGALIAASALMMPMLPGVKRPALLAAIPSKENPVAVIDVGGNVCCRASHLVSFARLAICYQKCQGIEKPRVGLLNIGVESRKGSREVQQAYQMLQSLKAPDWQFVGNVEGRDVFEGKVDVLVTDGFTGNVFLKTAEGTAKFVISQMQELLFQIGQDSSVARKAVYDLSKHLDYTEYPGALVSGINCGIAIKCHGSGRSMAKALCEAQALVKRDFIGALLKRVH